MCTVRGRNLIVGVFSWVWRFFQGALWHPTTHALCRSVLGLIPKGCSICVSQLWPLLYSKSCNLNPASLNCGYCGIHLIIFVGSCECCNEASDSMFCVGVKCGLLLWQKGEPLKVLKKKVLSYENVWNPRSMNDGRVLDIVVCRSALPFRTVKCWMLLWLWRERQEVPAGSWIVSTWECRQMGVGKVGF
jgi:hypothetical protein